MILSQSLKPKQDYKEFLNDSISVSVPAFDLLIKKSINLIELENKVKSQKELLDYCIESSIESDHKLKVLQVKSTDIYNDLENKNNELIKQCKRSRWYYFGGGIIIGSFIGSVVK